MPLYVFKWSDHLAPFEVSLENDDLAWSEAISSVGQLLRDADGEMPSHSALTLDVFDEDGRLIASVSVDAARRSGEFQNLHDGAP